MDADELKFKLISDLCDEVNKNQILADDAITMIEEILLEPNIVKNRWLYDTPEIIDVDDEGKPSFTDQYAPPVDDKSFDVV